jgi:hypothetical protein
MADAIGRNDRVQEALAGQLGPVWNQRAGPEVPLRLDPSSRLMD